MIWLMFLAGAIAGAGIGMLAGNFFTTRKILADGNWTDEFLASIRGMATWKQVKERSGYTPRRGAKLLRSTAFDARMKGWWAKTGPRDPEEIFRGT